MTGSEGTMLVTRTEPGASASAAQLEALGIRALAAPLLVRALIAAAIPKPGAIQAIVLTSQNALDGWVHNGGPDGSYLDLPLFAVGEKTASAARAAGFLQVHSSDGGLQELAELVTSAGPDGTYFYPCAEIVTGDLAALLGAGGRLILKVPVYRMQAVEALSKPVETALDAGNVRAVLCYSQRAATVFADLVSPKPELSMLCLSENVAHPLIEAGFARIGLADFPSEQGMMALALSFARGQIR